MPERVVDVQIEVPPATKDEGQRSGGAIRSSRRNKDKNQRFSPYSKSPGPGPATLLDDLSLQGGGPVSSRTRQRRANFSSLPPPARPNGAVAALQDAKDASSSSVDATSSSSGPLARQQVKEDRWRAKLSKEASWWDSAALAFAQQARQVDAHMSAATRAAAHSDSSLRTLMRARNHGRADRLQAEEWKASAIDEFLGRGSSSKRKSAKSPVRPKVDPPSPGHFERLYGPRRSSLPPLQMSKRSDLASSAQAARERERRNSEAREVAFCGSR